MGGWAESGQVKSSRWYCKEGRRTRTYILNHTPFPPFTNQLKKYIQEVGTS
ncbi:hypothetical protein MTR67_034617, partial [Solanum verrucosum]